VRRIDGVGWVSLGLQLPVTFVSNVVVLLFDLSPLLLASRKNGLPARLLVLEIAGVKYVVVLMGLLKVSHLVLVGNPQRHHSQLTGMQRWR